MSRTRVAFVTGVALLAGCVGSSPFMEEGEAPAGSEPGKALVYFLRPGRSAWSTDFEIWHGDAFIGHALADSCFAYNSPPGRQFFHAIGENRPGIDANLESDLTYYVLVLPRTGATRPRVALIPVTRGSKYWDASELWAKDLVFTVTKRAEADAWTAAKREESREIMKAFETAEGRKAISALGGDAGR